MSEYRDTQLICTYVDRWQFVLAKFKFFAFLISHQNKIVKTRGLSNESDDFRASSRISWC